MRAPTAPAPTRAMDCARELGKPEARLDALVHDAELVLGWMAAPTER
ncbi:hypothetical protein ACI797_15645 [Geodermatophilus sp. SYSU D00691]